MISSRAMKSFGTAAVMGSALACATPAMADIPLGCQDANAVRAALNDPTQPGGPQYVLVTGEATNDQRSRNIFTSNENGTLGYNVEQGSGNTTGQLCVIRKYTDVRVNVNLNSTTPPTWARFGEGTQNDRYFDAAIRGSDARILLGARALIPQADGTDLRGAFMIVSRGNNFGSVIFTRSDGTIIPDVSLANLADQSPNYQNFQARMRDEPRP